MTTEVPGVFQVLKGVIAYQVMFETGCTPDQALVAVRETVSQVSAVEATMESGLAVCVQAVRRAKEMLGERQVEG